MLFSCLLLILTSILLINCLKCGPYQEKSCNELLNNGNITVIGCKNDSSCLNENFEDCDTLDEKACNDFMKDHNKISVCTLVECEAISH